MEARLIDDLLDLTRVAKGEAPAQLRELRRLPRLAHSAMDICSVDVVGKQLTTTLDLSAKRHHVRGDPARLQQVFWNLIKNAVKFTPAGGHITVHSFDDTSGAIKVAVTDTGIGIEPAALSRIFDAFEQANQAVTRQFGGLGLGLAISKALIDLQGGKLTATSAGANRGSTFTLEMRPTAPTVAGDNGDAPVTSSAGGRRHARAQTPPTSASCWSTTTRTPTARWRRLLQRLGYDVAAAGRVQTPSAPPKATPFDLLISDIGLPDGSG
jgi:signal transduction histidine kinase